MSREVGYLGHSIDIFCQSHVIWTLLKICTKCCQLVLVAFFCLSAIYLLRAHGAYVLSREAVAEGTTRYWTRLRLRLHQNGLHDCTFPMGRYYVAVPESTAHVVEHLLGG